MLKYLTRRELMEIVYSSSAKTLNYQAVLGQLCVEKSQKCSEIVMLLKKITVQA